MEYFCRIISCGGGGWGGGGGGGGGSEREGILKIQGYKVASQISYFSKNIALYYDELEGFLVKDFGE